MIRVAKLEVEEAEEDEYGVSWEAPTQTSAAVTQPLLLLAPLLPSHCQAALCFSAGLQNSDVPLNNSKSQRGQTAPEKEEEEEESEGRRGESYPSDNRSWEEI